MPLPKRFALSTLLVVMLLVSLVFGYAQWRRQRITSAMAELNEICDPSLVPQMNDSLFWPTVIPNRVTLSFTRNMHGDFMRDGKAHSYEEMLSDVTILRDRFREAGVRGVYLQLFDEKGNVYSLERLSSSDIGGN